MTTRVELDRLTASAYIRFADARVPDELDACPHCFSLEEQSQLKAMALADIPERLLSDYHHAAHTKHTPVEETQYFLPRYLDLLASFTDYPTLYETALTRVHLDDWSASDRELLQDWAEAYATVALELHNDNPAPETCPSPDEVLIMLSAGGLDLSRILATWGCDASLGALAAFIMLWDNFDFTKQKLVNGFSTKALNSMVSSWISVEQTIDNFRASAARWLVSASAPVLEETYAHWSERTWRQRIQDMCDALMGW